MCLHVREVHLALEPLVELVALPVTRAGMVVEGEALRPLIVDRIAHPTGWVVRAERVQAHSFSRVFLRRICAWHIQRFCITVTWS